MRIVLRKKIVYLLVFIILFLILTPITSETLSVSARKYEQPLALNPDNSSYMYSFFHDTSNGFTIDQSQDQTNNHRYSTNGWYLVQSFKPMMSPLAKIDILLELRGYGNENNILELNIKEELDINSPSLSRTTISYSNFNEKKIWVEFFIENVTVTKDKTYFIYLTQQGYGDCYWYGIYNADHYQRGFAYGYNQGTNIWENLSDPAIFPDFDFSFKTYTLGNNNPPKILEIIGPPQGKPSISYQYSITVTDDENDPVYLFVDWSDGTTTNWIGPYDPSMPILVNHKWMKKGTYIISARLKDNLGNIGDWFELEVRMSLMVNYNHLFKKISDMHLMRLRDIIKC